VKVNARKKRLINLTLTRCTAIEVRIGTLLVEEHWPGKPAKENAKDLPPEMQRIYASLIGVLMVERRLKIGRHRA
jgi:hypothetical protein